MTLSSPATSAQRPGGSAYCTGVGTILLVLLISLSCRAEPAPVVDAPTDAIIHSALKYLAARQSPSGSWGAGNNFQAAMTGYCLVAYMTAGELPGEGEFGPTCSKAVTFLLQCVRADGYIAAPVGESNMYNHGIATIALGEVYGQTRDAAVRPKLERAVKLIIGCQNAEGGWRYQPRIADADISVTVLQVVALRVARNSGLDVPQSTIDRAVAFVKSCNDPVSGGFGYQPQSHNNPGFARTAAAMYSLQVCGLYSDPMVARASQYLLKQSSHWPDNPMQGSGGMYFTYGNFYAAPAEYMIGNDSWSHWYGQMKQMLLAPGTLQQSPEGFNYWRPLDGGTGVNDIYATAVYSTILSMPYGYLPLYQR